MMKRIAAGVVGLIAILILDHLHPSIAQKQCDPTTANAIATFISNANEKMNHVLAMAQVSMGGDQQAASGVEAQGPDAFTRSVNAFVRDGMPAFERGVRLAEAVTGKRGCTAVATTAIAPAAAEQCAAILSFVGEQITTTCDWIWRPRHHDDLTYTPTGTTPAIEFCVKMETFDLPDSDPRIIDAADRQGIDLAKFGERHSKLCLSDVGASCLLKRHRRRAFWRKQYFWTLLGDQQHNVRRRSDRRTRRGEEGGGFHATRLNPREGGIFFLHFDVVEGAPAGESDKDAPTIEYHHPKLQVRADIPKFANELGLTGEGVEVGVCFGMHAAALLDTWRGARLYLVDPWAPVANLAIDPAEEVRYPNPAKVARAKGCDSDHALHYTRSRLLEAGHAPERFQLVRTTSVEAAAYFEDGQLDFAYIDGNHHYRSCSEDVAAWWPKVRRGGLVAGHDFTNAIYFSAHDLAGRNPGSLPVPPDVWAAVEEDRTPVVPRSLLTDGPTFGVLSCVQEVARKFGVERVFVTRQDAPEAASWVIVKP